MPIPALASQSLPATHVPERAVEEEAKVFNKSNVRVLVERRLGVLLGAVWRERGAEELQEVALDRVEEGSADLLHHLSEEVIGLLD